MDKSKLNTIFLAGAAKSGTTSLYQVLRRHPEICCPIVKEPNFFSNLGKSEDIVGPGAGPGDKGTVWTDTPAKYRSLFRVEPQHRFLLDASVSYLYSSKAAAYMAAAHPDAKVIIVLRNPVDRAFSHYKHLVRDGRESLPFEKALEMEGERRRQGWEFSWHLKNMSLYSEQIKRYLDCFGGERVRFFLLEDLITDFPGVLRSVMDFTGLSEADLPVEVEKDNQSGLSKSRNLARFMNWLAGYKVAINKVVSPELTHTVMQRVRAFNMRSEKLQLDKLTRARLMAYFEEDIERTEQLIGRDLSAWRTSQLCVRSI